jgi:hypothetical protein
MTQEYTIKCPECGSIIDVNDALIHQIEEKLKKSYERKIAKEKQEISDKIKELEKKEQSLMKKEEKIKEEAKKEAEKILTVERNKIRQKIEEEKSEEIKALLNELNLKSEQIKELNRTKAEIEKLRREKEELKEIIALEKEKEFSEKLKEERLKLQKLEEEKHLLKIRELEKKLEDQTKLVDEMKRKAEQGSMQLQGEIQELELEKILKELYPFDVIKEVKKGQKGADLIQIVRDNHGNECGKIYYESKRTKNFENSWIQKLKEDNLDVKADALIIVTEAMPPDSKLSFFEKDGVWICSFRDIKSFSLIIRHSLMQISMISNTQKDKGTKMEILYNYLTSQEFRSQLEAIIEGFKALQDGYQEEKLRMQKIWKEREKQLEKVLSNTINFYGSIKGIAGKSIPDIPLLEGGGKLQLPE